MLRTGVASACLLGVFLTTPTDLRAEPSQQEVDAYIAADKNKDGHLSRPEFRQFVKLMAKAGNPKAKQIRFWRAYRYAFGIADRNRDGLIAPANSSRPMRRTESANAGMQDGAAIAWRPVFRLSFPVYTRRL